MLSDLQRHKVEKDDFSHCYIIMSCGVRNGEVVYADDLATELAATHQRMEQTFHDFRMANGDIIKKSWHHIYEQLEQNILKEVK